MRSLTRHINEALSLVNEAKKKQTLADWFEENIDKMKSEKQYLRSGKNAGFEIEDLKNIADDFEMMYDENDEKSWKEHIERAYSMTNESLSSINEQSTTLDDIWFALDELSDYTDRQDIGESWDESNNKFSIKLYVTNKNYSNLKQKFVKYLKDHKIPFIQKVNVFTFKSSRLDESSSSINEDFSSNFVRQFQPNVKAEDAERNDLYLSRVADVLK